MDRPPAFLIAPDKFKGSLDAAGAAAAIRAGILLIFPDAPCVTVPLADGGEGTADVFVSLGLGKRITTRTTDALGRQVTAGYVLLDDGKTAVIETAAAAGLAQIAPEDRDPLQASTEGLGRLIRHALDQGAVKICLGLGGSATNDAGCGLAHALGWKFLDADGRRFVPTPAALAKLERIEPPENALEFECTALADVSNPLLGPRGATRTYGPQKGAGPADLDRLESALARVGGIAAKCLDSDHRETPGTGAAGGLGFATLAFLRGSIRPGFEYLAALCGIPAKLDAADWVITGEGKLDAQSFEGKGPVALARMAKERGKPVIALAGSVTEYDPELFAFASAIADGPMTLEESVAATPRLLTRAAANVASLIRAASANQP